MPRGCHGSFPQIAPGHSRSPQVAPGYARSPSSRPTSNNGSDQKLDSHSDCHPFIHLNQLIHCDDPSCEHNRGDRVAIELRKELSRICILFLNHFSIFFSIFIIFFCERSPVSPRISNVRKFQTTENDIYTSFSDFVRNSQTFEIRGLIGSEQEILAVSA